MIFLKNKTNGYEFKYITKDSYKVREYQDETSVRKMAGGPIKTVYNDYVNCEISIELGLLDGSNIKETYDKLVNGAYEYYYTDDVKKHSANFKVEKGELSPYHLNGKVYFNPLTINLIKSSDEVVV
ncbi:MAG: hypothetical protein RR191_06755 [Cetobacterium sp.]